MTDLPSVIFLTMQTSASGSYWRLISAIAGGRYRTSQPVQALDVTGRAAEIPGWRPEPSGHVYLYNTPHIVNPSLAAPGQKLIINFRDPRDLVCNLYHWVFEHPVHDQPAEKVAARRARVAADGIDNFARDWNAFVIFASLHAIEARLKAEDALILKLSYAQICLDFDTVVEKLIAFLGVRREDVRWDLVERERASNLSQNPAWIGNLWAGTDIVPGRHRVELQPETVGALDDKFRTTLKFLRGLEAPAFRHLLATETERIAMEQVLVGRADELFLRHDEAGNDMVAQITGKQTSSQVELFRIGLAHRSRQQFGELLGGFSYAHAIIPGKEVAHRHLLPAGVEYEQDGLRPVASYFAAGFGALWQPFYEPDTLVPNGETRFYPRTDQHWNHAGMLTYLQAFLERANPTKAAALKALAVRRWAASRQGDLGGKIEMPAEMIEMAAPAHPTARIVFDNDIKNAGSVVWYRNAAVQDGSRTLVLHDSFANPLREFIAELFGEAVFVQSSVFDYEFVEELAPQTVICLQAERFFLSRPETGGDLFNFISQQEAEQQAPRHLRDFWDALRVPAMTETAFAPLLAAARQAAQQFDWALAAALNGRLREVFGAAIEGWRGGARAAREMAQYDVAEALLAQAAERFAGDRVVLAERALLMQVQRNWGEAVSRWKLVLAAAPDFDGGHVGHAQCLRAAGRLAEAQASLDDVRDMFPDSPALWIERGRLATMRQDWPAALEAFETARRLQPDQPQWVAEVMAVHYRQQNFAAAEALAVAELPRFPDRPEIAIQQAQIAFWRRDLDSAVRLWAGLHGRFPDNVRVLSGLAEALAGAREDDRLVVVLDDLLERAPDHVLGTLLYAAYEQRHGRAEAALVRLAAAVARTPHDRHLVAALADAKSRVSRQPNP